MTTPYVYQLIEKLIKSLQPDNVNHVYPYPNSVYSPQQEQIPVGWFLYFNNLKISIQCGEYNYCDHYPLSRARDPQQKFRYTHPYTHTAEVAVISCDGHWVDFDDDGDDEYVDNIVAYASLARIEDIVMTIATYSGRSIGVSA